MFLWDDPAAIGMLLTDEEEEETLLARDDKVTKLLDELWCDITFSDGHDRGIAARVDDRKDRNWEKGGEIQEKGAATHNMGAVESLGSVWQHRRYNSGATWL